SELARRSRPGVWLCLAAALLLAGILVLEATAQSPGGPEFIAPGAPQVGAPQLGAPQVGAPPRLVADVRILGNRGVSEAKIYAQIRTRKDREFDPEVLQGDVRRLV